MELSFLYTQTGVGEFKGYCFPRKGGYETDTFVFRRVRVGGVPRPIGLIFSGGGVGGGWALELLNPSRSAPATVEHIGTKATV